MNPEHISFPRAIDLRDQEAIADDDRSLLEPRCRGSYPQPNSPGFVSDEEIALTLHRSVQNQGTVVIGEGQGMRSGSDVEEEMAHIPIPHHIFLALDT